MSDRLLPALAEARQRFMDLVAELRPKLHRYCARMTGSVFDGEDIVQDVYVRALQALSDEGAAIDNLEGWLFRIANNAALDWLRRRARRDPAPADEIDDVADAGAGPETPIEVAA